VLSDVSAAYLEQGRVTGDRSHFESARDAAKQALLVDKSYARAYFNLALSYEGLAEMSPARDAWREYLALDSSSDWAREAQRHLEDDRRPQSK
jgi:Tfp pilus assembly protein PilF